MSLEIDIRKKLYNFELNAKINSKCRRIGILGASGCGKSLTLKCIAGIETPDRGYIRVDGKTLFERGETKRGQNLKPQERRVGYLFQNYALFPTMSVEKNISAGIRGSKNEKAERVRQMIRKFRLEGLEKHLPGELSGGQQQRVALARIMAYEPDMILLDEPFSALDGFLKDRLLKELLEMLNDYEGTIILVSHSRDEIYRFSEELVIMDAGKTICHGKTKDVFDDPVYHEAGRLTGCKNIVRAERLDDHSIYVPSWDTKLRTKKNIRPDVQYVGVRAHDFVPDWGEISDRTGFAGEIPVGACTVAELPFERNYYLKSADGKEDICWFVQRDLYEKMDANGMPEGLLIPEEKILFMK